MPDLSRRSLALGALAAPLVPALAPAPAPAARAAGPLGRARRGRGLARLTLGRGGVVRRRGKVFRTGGVNAFQLITNDYPSPRLMSHAEIDSLLAKARAVGAGVVRAHTLAASVGNPHTLVTGVSGSGPDPTISYDPAVWDAIDHAVWRAGQLGIYLVAPLVDELGYYHGGKRHWVELRHPGSVSLDSSVKAATSPAQRAAENAFYTDQQVVWDFEKFIRDWLHHVNPRTGVAFKDDPVLSIVQVGNELWTAAQDAPGWVAAKAALIKSISPTTLVMDSGADGLAVEDMAWDSPHVDILETHPYTTFGADDVSRMAAFAASHGKAFAVGEYAWTKPSAPAIESAVRRSPHVLTSALWSLQNDADLHHEAARWGDDDVSFYVPGSGRARERALRRVVRHHRRLAHPARPAARSRRRDRGAVADQE